MRLPSPTSAEPAFGTGSALGFTLARSTLFECSPHPQYPKCVARRNLGTHDDPEQASVCDLLSHRIQSVDAAQPRLSDDDRTAVGRYGEALHWRITRRPRDYRTLPLDIPQGDIALLIQRQQL